MERRTVDFVATPLIQNALEESNKIQLMLPHQTLVNVFVNVQNMMKDVVHPAQIHLEVLAVGRVGFLNVGSVATPLIQNALEEFNKKQLLHLNKTLVNVLAMVQDMMKDADHPAQIHLEVLAAGPVGFLNVGSVGLEICLHAFNK